MAKDTKGHGSEKRGLSSARGMAAAKAYLQSQIKSGMMKPVEVKPTTDHPKSDEVPEQSGGGGGFQAAARSFSDKTATMSANKAKADGTVGRHGYRPDSVDKAINSASRHQGKVSGKERSAIHRLLRGRG